MQAKAGAEIGDTLGSGCFRGNSAGDLFGMLKTPCQGLSGLQLGDEKVTN